MARNRNVAAEKKVTADDAVIADSILNEDAEIAALEAALDGEDVEIETDETPIDGVSAADADTEPQDDDVAAAIESDEAKSEAYADQTSDMTETDEDSGTQKVKRNTTPRTKLPYDETIKAMFSEEPAVLDTEEGELTEEQLDATLIKAVTQVKVREKVVNLLQSITAGSDPSIYTKVALELVLKGYLDGSNVSLADIKKAYEAKGYKAGTVNAQAGQMMALFPVLRIAHKKDRGLLTPNKNSVILDALASR